MLIPRPETELLVERALALATRFERPLIADVGTGSGAIAVSLVAALPQVTAIATDISRPALTIARLNAQRHLPSELPFVQADLLQPFSSKFDLICANLPYIPTHKLEGLPVSQWEPTLALDGGVTGLDLIERLLHQAASRLSPSGVILLETESSLGRASLSLAETIFPDAEIALHQDLAGQDRLVEIQTP